MEIENFEYVDIVPLIMDYYKKDNSMIHWQHPFIESYYNPDEDEYDLDVYRIYWKNEKEENLHICFKSKYLDKKVEEHINNTSIEDGTFKSISIFKEPYINVQNVYESLHLMLTEDFFVLFPNVEFEVKNSKDYKKFRTIYQSEQFLFTDFGKLINEEFSSYKIEFFSLDCGMFKDDDGLYSWDS